MQNLNISKEDAYIIKHAAWLWYRKYPKFKEDILQLAYEAYFVACEEWKNFDHESRPDVKRGALISLHTKSYLRHHVLKEVSMIRPPACQVYGLKDKKDKFVHNTFCSDDVLLLTYRVNPHMEAYCDKKRMRKNLQEFYPMLKPRRQEWFKMWLNEVSFVDIGKMYGVTKQAVENAVKKDIKKFKKLYYK